MATLRVGDPLDKSTDIGAIVADVQLERIRALVEQGRAEGAVCWQPDCALPDKGLFYPPTLVTGVAPASILAQEEIFGPVLVVDDVPHAGRGGRARQQHPLRPRRLRLVGERSTSRSTPRRA